jgi:hypothetical protein
MCSREVACFQRRTNWIFKYYLERNDGLCGPVVWVPDYRSRGPLSLVNTIKGLLGRKCSGSGLEILEYGSRNVTQTTWHPLSTNLALTSPTSGGHSVQFACGLRQRSLVLFNFSVMVKRASRLTSPATTGSVSHILSNDEKGGSPILVAGIFHLCVRTDCLWFILRQSNTCEWIYLASDLHTSQS